MRSAWSGSRWTPWRRAALGGLLCVGCERWGHEGIAGEATILTADGHLGYMLLPVRGTPSSADVERGHQFLAGHCMAPEVIAGLVPSGWPVASDDQALSVLVTLEADPAVASAVARGERRRKVMSALVGLGSVTCPEEV